MFQATDHLKMKSIGIKISNFKKYQIAYQAALSTFLQYRINVALFAIGHLVSLSGLAFVWLSVYESGQQLGSYTLPEILTYYILIAFLRLTIADGVSMGFQVVEDIKDGRVAPYLLKPINYPLSMLADSLGHATINLVLVTPVIALILFITGTAHYLPPLPSLAFFFGFMLVGLLFYYLIYFLSALSSFWLDRGSNIIYGLIVMSNFLNGAIIPIDIFPEWLIHISNYLPFQFLMYTPIQFWLGRAQNIPAISITAVSWLIILSIITVLVWRLGIKKFEAVGQ